MFIGHFAVGLAAKRAAPRASLGTLFLAAQFLDLLWPTFVLLGLETVEIKPGITAVTPLDFTSYPYSHSLVAACVWSLLFALVYGSLRRDGRGGLVLGLVVLSHWVLDWISHRPDMPIALGGGPRFGLGLWHSLAWTMAVEVPLLALGCFVYLRATRARDRSGVFACWGLFLFLFGAYLAAILGPAPPNVSALGWGGQAVWLLVVWGYWIDRHREGQAG